jgi:hypothetical protein
MKSLASSTSTRPSPLKSPSSQRAAALLSKRRLDTNAAASRRSIMPSRFVSPATAAVTTADVAV